MEDKILNLFKLVSSIPGAISLVETAGMYYGITKSFSEVVVEPGIAIDLGSHSGKSSYIAASALSDLGRKNSFFMVDVLYNKEWDDNKKEEIKDRFKSIHGLDLALVGKTSTSFLEEIKGEKISYVFIDVGDHDKKTLDVDINLIDKYIVPGGIVGFHDFGNQYGDPIAKYRECIESGKYEAIDLNWERWVNLVKKNDLEKDNNSWHKYPFDEIIFVGMMRKIK